MIFCACSQQGIAVDRVVPASGPNTELVPVRIEGTGFLPITSNVDDGKTSTDKVVIEIAGVALDAPAWRSEDLIEATVPTGLPVGTHDVTVTLGPKTAALPGGYEVVDGVAVCSTNGLACSGVMLVVGCSGACWASRAAPSSTRWKSTASNNPPPASARTSKRGRTEKPK